MQRALCLAVFSFCSSATFLPHTRNKAQMDGKKVTRRAKTYVYVYICMLITHDKKKAGHWAFGWTAHTFKHANVSVLSYELKKQ
jgi:hypothetical protein